MANFKTIASLAPLALKNLTVFLCFNGAESAKRELWKKHQK